MALRTETADHFAAFSEAIGDEVPLYSRISELIVDDPELLELAGRARAGQPPPNMLFAAVQYLLGTDDPLAPWYPALSGPDVPVDDPYPLFRDFCFDRRSELVDLISTRRTQTNEAARCIALLPALAHAYGLVDQPLSLFEIGSSAGLLLAFDRYRYDFAGRSWGLPESPVHLEAEVRGSEPPLPPRPLPISRRLGIDLHPVDLTDDSQVRWLGALVWPGHEERRQRLRAAVDLVASDPPSLVAGDALDVLPAEIAAVGRDEVPVVFHSFALIQWTPEARAELDDLLQRAGRRVIRIWLEWFGYRRSLPIIRVVDYRPGSVTGETLGRFHHHGRWLEWGWRPPIDPQS
ncbi:MAG: DUF2332 domain-containing protein [Acidimicrobiia bacterium]